VIIKVLFVILVLSSIALAAVAIAVFVRVRWHLKARQAKANGTAAETPQESNPERQP
jgi:hypothetical protein